MNSDIISIGEYVMLLVSILWGVLCLLCFIYYDKNSTFRKIGDGITTFRFAGKDKSQLLVMSILSFFLAIGLICTLVLV
jgi:hypothetical protein